MRNLTLQRRGGQAPPVKTDPASHHPPNRLDIATASVAGRVRALVEQLGAGVRVLAAVKADGYGFGALPCARAALAGGAWGLALANRAQAIALREAGIAAPILLYAGAPLDAAGVGAADAGGTGAGTAEGSGAGARDGTAAAAEPAGSRRAARVALGAGAAVPVGVTISGPKTLPSPGKTLR